MAQFKARKAQQKILEYTDGFMGIKAVPGSGKTHTLSYLAAKLIKDGAIREDQEILIVTLVNSAVENFSQRISGFIQDFGMLPNTGYRVRTLHGLAHDIVRERPDLAGLSDRFQILDEREADTLLHAIVSNWIRVHPDFIENFTKPDAKESAIGLIRMWETLLIRSAMSFIRIAKDQQYDAATIRDRIEKLGVEDDFLRFGLDIYQEYQHALHYRSAIDYDDLIWLALRALESDEEFLERLRSQWPYILEDEAQDSSRLQERILRFLSGENGNWVRVGDPNQAIFETFTTAHPRYLLQFIERPDVIEKELPDSGRSTPSIIMLANHLITWSRSHDNPNSELRNTLVPPLINPTPPQDPQPNPTDHPEHIHLFSRKLTPDSELKAVTDSVARWLPDNQDKTVAVLVPRNERGAKIVAALNQVQIEPVELLRSSASTRETADILTAVLEHLSEPTALRHLAKLYRKIAQFHASQDTNSATVDQVYSLLQKYPYPENLIWPESEESWFAELNRLSADESQISELKWFCRFLQKWHQAAILSIDQMILSISQDLFSLPVDLALAHKLSLTLEVSEENHPEWRLPDFSNELRQIAENRQKFYGFTGEDTGFDPEEHKGKVVVSTMHKAKGLEWDRVYLLSVNNYDFPYGFPEDNYIGEKWFVKGEINIEEEMIARLQALLAEDTIGLFLEPGEATRLARIEYAKERLRLFYVGITRAKSELVITWNTGKNGQNTPSIPFSELISFWNAKHVPTE